LRSKKILILKKILFALLFLPFFANSQDRHHEIGVFGGTANYYGDLNPEFFGKNGYSPVGGIMYKYFVNPRFGYRFGAKFAELTAADSLSYIAHQRQRNLDFTTNLFELHGAFELNFLNIDPDRTNIKYHRWSPYIFGGISTFYANPYTNDLNNTKVYLRPLSTEGQGLPQYTDRRNYNLINFAAPFGGGLKVLVGRKVLISTEIGIRYAFTDYLDDVSKSYVDYDVLFAEKGQQSVDLSWRTDELRGKLANEKKDFPKFGYKRGDENPNDFYWFAGLGVNIYFDSFGNIWPNRQQRCPRPNRN
jgi:hypothetical protein